MPLVPIKRRSHRTEEELRKQLLQVPEISHNSLPPQSRHFLASAPKNRRYRPEELPDLAGLPMRMGVDCQLGKEAAEDLQAHSRKLRSVLADVARADPSDPRPNFNELRRRLLAEGAAVWQRPEAIPALMQLLTAENKSIRYLLLELLAGIEGPQASVALARRALYDTAFEVRAAAIQALSVRPREEFRAQLLEGLRYAWAPVADHAAEALVALRDRDAVPALRRLLDEPDPSAPVVGPNHQLFVRELVRINHLSNCLLCHSQSTSALDPVRGQIPSPSQPLPPPVQYYESTHGTFARADITYLQQDFSVPQPVARPGPWPAHQRYDYVVRTRPARVAELRATAAATPWHVGPFPAVARQSHDAKAMALAGGEPNRWEQWEAVRFALRELTREEASGTE